MPYINQLMSVYGMMRLLLAKDWLRLRASHLVAVAVVPVAITSNQGNRILILIFLPASTATKLICCWEFAIEHWKGVCARGPRVVKADDEKGKGATVGK